MGDDNFTWLPSLHTEGLSQGKAESHGTGVSVVKARASQQGSRFSLLRTPVCLDLVFSFVLLPL